MMEREYRKEMERVTLSPEQKARIVQAMVQEQPQKRRRRPPVRMLLAAVLACGVLTTSALALSPTLRDTLAQVLGGFLSYSQEPEGAVAVDQDVEVRVVSAVTDQYRMKIYIEVTDLTGERFSNDAIRLSAAIPRKWGSSGVMAVPSLIAYDEQRHTALFELEQSGYHQAEKVEELELKASRITTGIYDVDTQPLPTELLSDRYLETMTLDNGDLVLVPEQTPAELEGEGTDLFRLSSMGFAPDGTLQVIFQLSDEVILEDEDNVLLGSSHFTFTTYMDGEPLHGSDAELKDCAFIWNGKQYIGLSQEIPSAYENQKDGITFSSVNGKLITQRALEPIEGDWDLTFQVENYPVKEVELTGAIGEWPFPTTFAISPLGAIATGSYEVGSWANGPFAVLYEDGTRFESFERKHSVFYPDELCVLGNWEFTEPLDLDRAVAVEIWNWYIPLTGPEAGVVRPK